MRILYIYANLQGTGFYRCFYPGHQLEKYDNEVYFAEDLGVDESNVPDLSWDVYVFQLTQSQRGLDSMKRLKEAGKVVIYEVDDYVHAIPTGNPLYEAFHPASGRVLEMMEKCMRSADAVTVSTTELAELYAPLNAMTVPLPNCVDFDDEHWDVPRRPPDGGVVVGWVGSPSHIDDFKVVLGPLERLCRRYPNVKIAIGGPEEVFDLLTGVPAAQKKYLPPVNFFEYPNLPAQFDIGLVPLVDNKFNRCKSHLKGLEYARLSLPFLASPLPSYERLVRDGMNGCLCSRPREWYSKLCELVESPGRREAMGREALETARAWSIADHAVLWQGLYAALVRLKHETGASVLN